MIKYIVYKLTRDDGQLYIGTTNTQRFKNRMYIHKISRRFKNHKFDIKILYKSKNRQEIDYLEEYYIEKFDSFYNGLNESIDGKGNHHAPNFTTTGFKYSERSKQKMSDSAKKRIEKIGVNFKGYKHTNKIKEKMSEKRKGIIYRKTKLNYESVGKIRDFFDTKPVIKYGEIQKNGKILTYERAFANEFHKQYGITPTALYNVIIRRTWNGAVFFTK